MSGRAKGKRRKTISLTSPPATEPEPEPQPEPEPPSGEEDSSSSASDDDDEEKGEEGQEEGQKEGQKEGQEETQEEKGHAEEMAEQDRKSRGRKRKVAVGRKANTQAFMFTLDEEDALCDWFEANPILYKKRHRDYKNTPKKVRIYQERGEIYDPPATWEQIKMWCTNMRTHFGKLTQPAPRTGAPRDKSPTDRTKWILRRFTFLEKHIARHKGKSSGRLDSDSSYLSSCESGRDDGTDVLSAIQRCLEVPDGGDGDGGDDGDDGATPSASAPSAPASSSHSHSKKKKNKKDDGKEKEPEMQAISDLVTAFTKQQQQKPAETPQRPLSPASREEQCFSGDIAALMRRIPQDRWVDLRFDVLGVVRSYPTPTMQRPSPQGFGYQQQFQPMVQQQPLRPQQQQPQGQQSMFNLISQQIPQHGQAGQQQQQQQQQQAQNDNVMSPISMSSISDMFN